MLNYTHSWISINAQNYYVIEINKIKDCFFALIAIYKIFKICVNEDIRNTLNHFLI